MAWRRVNILPPTGLSPSAFMAGSGPCPNQLLLPHLQNGDVAIIPSTFLAGILRLLFF